MDWAGCDFADPPVRLAYQWTAAINDSTGNHIVAMSATEVRNFLQGLARQLVAAAETEDGAVAAETGAALARARFVADDVLGTSIRLLSTYFTENGATPARIATTLGAFATGYVRTFRAWLLSQQEGLRAAERAAERDAQHRDDSASQFRAMFSQAGIGTGLTDMNGRVIEVNTALATMLGYQPPELQGASVEILMHPDDPSGFRTMFSAMLRGERDYLQTEKACRHHDGHMVWTNINMSLIRDEHRQALFALAVVEDISEQRALREHLHHRAHHDPLTGVANRSRFFDALTTAFADAEASIGLCYIDLDQLKAVNDTLGHAVGDVLLAAAAERVGRCANDPEQLVARMGGDEFVVLVPSVTDITQLTDIADAVLDRLATPFEVYGHTLTVTASVGVVVERAHQTTPDELLQCADTAMYWAKSDGGDRYSVFDPVRRRREHTRLDLTAAMPTALQRGEFFLDYQPIVGLIGQEPTAVEALVRWQHPEMGVLAPSRFVELAEESGHIAALGMMVLERACRDTQGWQEQFGQRTPVMSVNVSATEVADPAWLGRVQRTIAETGIAPSQLQLELTERVFMHATGRPLQSLRTLAETGVRVAIDDFGTGYSNLAYLGRLPIHVVKLAGPFIHRIRTASTTSHSDLLVLEAIIDLSHQLGLRVTAECVETSYQADQLLSLGCDTAQGWHFHRPMPAQALTKILASAYPVAQKSL